MSTPLAVFLFATLSAALQPQETATVAEATEEQPTLELPLHSKESCAAPYGEHPLAQSSDTRFAVGPSVRQISETENVTEKWWLPCHKRPISDARERFKREGWREPPIDSLCCFPKKGCFR